MKLLKSNLISFVAVVLLTSGCEFSRQAEEKLNEINNKVERLDSTVNNEINKVRELDSMINFEGSEIRKVDSLINNASSKFDSVTNRKIESLENIAN